MADKTPEEEKAERDAAIAAEQKVQEENEAKQKAEADAAIAKTEADQAAAREVAAKEAEAAAAKEVADKEAADKAAADKDAAAANAKSAVVYSKNGGHIRTYDSETHGENFAELAKEFSDHTDGSRVELK